MIATQSVACQELLPCSHDWQPRLSLPLRSPPPPRRLPSLSPNAASALSVDGPCTIRGQRPPAASTLSGPSADPPSSAVSIMRPSTSPLPVLRLLQAQPSPRLLRLPTARTPLLSLLWATPFTSVRRKSHPWLACAAHHLRPHTPSNLQTHLLNKGSCIS